MRQWSWMFRRTTLAGQLLALQVTIILVVLVAVAALTLAQSAAAFSSVEGRRVAALAEQLADNPLVRDRLPRPAPGETLAPVVQAFRTQSDITSVTIADARGMIVSSTDPILVRTLLPLGDPGVAEGRGWSGELVVDGSRELVAQVPVLSAEPGTLGQRLGTVMIGERSPTIWQRARDGAGNLAIFLGIASLVGIAGSWLEARRIKHHLALIRGKSL